MKSKFTNLLFGMALTPCICLAQGAPEIIDSIEQRLDLLVDALVVCAPGAATRFIDNGDGTICDHETGLMWEQKNAAGGGQDLTNPHDVDNNYTWTSTGTAPDGTAFIDFLARLNGEIADTAPTDQLGGHSDWRMPTSAELQTVVDCSFGSPCIDLVFNPAAATFTWSSTTNANGAAFAWSVNFSSGSPVSGFKTNAIRVRAVRGGR